MNKNSYSDRYKEAGVDVTAGYKAVELMKSHVARTQIPGVVSGIEAGMYSMNLGFALLYAFFAGIGFTVAMVLMGGVREKMEKLPVAKCMKGFPITMVAASFMAMAFYVFALL